MRPALGFNLTQSIQSWHQVPLAPQLQQLEMATITPILQRCFGYHLLKIGELAAQVDTSQCLIEYQVQFTEQYIEQTGVTGHYDDLPFQSNSVDAILMMHVLENNNDPHQVLREAHRVLLANGNLVLTLFNPYSLLWFNKQWPITKNKAFTKGRWFSLHRICDWLQLLGFEVQLQQYCSYASSFTPKESGDDSRIAKVQKLLFPKSGNVCVIKAKKREWPVTPVRPRVRYQSVFKPAVRGVQANRIK